MPDELPEQLPILPEHMPANFQEMAGMLLTQRALLHDMTKYLLLHASDRKIVEQYCRNCAEHFANDGTRITAMYLTHPAPSFDEEGEGGEDDRHPAQDIAQGIEKMRLDFLRFLDHFTKPQNL